jgi:hypothetical protein
MQFACLLVCLFACLLVCLFACLVLHNAPLTHLTQEPLADVFSLMSFPRKRESSVLVSITFISSE